MKYRSYKDGGKGRRWKTARKQRGRENGERPTANTQAMKDKSKGESRKSARRRMGDNGDGKQLPETERGRGEGERIAKKEASAQGTIIRAGMG